MRAFQEVAVRTVKETLTRWIWDTPKPARNTAELGLYIGIAIGNFKTALGVQILPPALLNTPHVFGMVVIILMVLGALILIAGLTTPEPYRFPIYQVGLSALGIASFVYGIAVFSSSGWDRGSTVISQAWGYSLGAFIRYWQVEGYLRAEKKRAEQETR